MKNHLKTSPKRILVTIFSTTLITSAIIIGLIYQFRPQSPTEDLSLFINKLPGMSSLTNQISSSSAKLPKTGFNQNLNQATKDLDSLNIDNFDASISQNDQ